MLLSGYIGGFSSMVKRHFQFKRNELYHIYNRGVNRKKIFFEFENYHYFLNRIERYLLPVMEIHAYCLMTTHYHLLMHASSSQKNLDQSKPVSKAMQKLSISYTKAINNRYDRVGPLFQGAYQVRIIDNQNHLEAIITYIHQNPVEVGLAKEATDWKYSSARAYEGHKETDIVTFLD
jgi:REP element-mobilizing transposase RayT